MKTLTIHSEKLLPILKRWLYSDKEIFVRELVSNACDAIAKLKHLAGATEGRIDIAIEGKTLRFSDTGLGMTADEVEKYIAQLAFSGAEEFVQAYEAKDEMIGHFGLGFYSAYMVADTVEIQTRSYTGAEPAHWRCEGGAEYTLELGTREETGTDVILHIEDDEYLEPTRIRTILQRYCSFLPTPIYFQGDQINKETPLFAKNPSECTDEEYRTFFRQLYPMEEEPLFWVHVNVDVPFHLQGILYFPRLRRDFDFSKNSIQLFCNRVFVADSCKDLIPDYLMALRGALDSPDIPLNVSRSTLQMDRTVRQVAGHIAKKVADRLKSLYRTERDQFLKCWPDLEVILKLGAMQDQKFCERIEECLVWETTEGQWVTLADAREGGDTLFYTSGEPPCLQLYKDRQVLKSSALIDSHLFSFLERKHEGLHFKRIDASLDSEGENSQEIADRFKEMLDIDVEAKSLPGDLPALLLIDEQSRRLRDLYPEMPVKSTLVVNTDNPLIVKALENPDLAQHIYDLARLGQGELPSADLTRFVERSILLLS